MSVAQRIRFPMARRSERLDPYETPALRYHGLHAYDSGRR